MMRTHLIYFLAMLTVMGFAHSAEISNSSQPLTAYGQSWQQCNHHLVRKGIFFKVADIDWFSIQCPKNQDILTTTPILLRFTYMRDVKRDFFIDSATEYFLRNLDETQSIQTKKIITDFNQSYQDVSDGDVYDLLIGSKGSLKLYKNKQLLKSSQNPLIINNYFKIWFGQDPVLPNLKDSFVSS